LGFIKLESPSILKGGRPGIELSLGSSGRRSVSFMSYLHNFGTT
jgi:hypothetical protein